MRSQAIKTLTVAALTASTLLAACADSPQPVSPRTNVLLIVVDTLGARHVGAYGLPGVSTPNIDRLAEHGTLFSRAYSTAPWTQPAVASLFTSQMPSRHGVRNLLDRLPDESVTLAEQLSALGYKTFASVSHFLIGHEFNYDQGFDQLSTEAVAGHDGLTSPAVTDEGIRFLEQVDEDPFFLFVHYFDPHFLYNHHEAFDQTSDYGGNLVPSMPVWQLRDMRTQLRPLDLAYIVGLYHEEIAYTDHHIGRLLTRLQELGLDENTLIIFTADHGEEFMEHGWIGHTRTLFDDLIHVPLIVRPPGGQPGSDGNVIAEPVSTLDVMPTILELAAARAPDPLADGQSLAGWLDGSATDADANRRIYAEVSFDPPTGDPDRAAQKRAFKSAMIRGDRKLIHDEESDTWQFFNRAADGAERRDLWGKNAERDARWQAELRAWEEKRSEGVRDAGNSPDDEALQRLRDLGYVH